MKKYSKEWKLKKRCWIQNHGDCWRVHWIEYDTEYRGEKHFSQQSAEVELNNSKEGEVNV